MTQRTWMKTRMIAYFIAGVLIGAGFPLWAQLFMGGVQQVPRGILWGLVTLTIALTLISMALRLRERLNFPRASRPGIPTPPVPPAYRDLRNPAIPLSRRSSAEAPSASHRRTRTPRD